jgi:Rrf2 family protein
VKSYRGAIRGYALARPPQEIRLREIFEAIEGPGLFERCVFWPEQCSDQKPCLLHSRWAKIRPQLQAMMEETTLDQVAESRTGRPIADKAGAKKGKTRV